jgi:hypothetical protein
MAVSGFHSLRDLEAVWQNRSSLYQEIKYSDHFVNSGGSKTAVVLRYIKELRLSTYFARIPVPFKQPTTVSIPNVSHCLAEADRDKFAAILSAAVKGGRRS